MSLFTALVFPMLLALGGSTAPSKPVNVPDGAQFESPERVGVPLVHHMRRKPMFGTGPAGPAHGYPEGEVVSRPSGRDATSKFHALPRSLPATPSNSSSVGHPLLVGIVIGVVGTLSVLGIAFILRRVYRRKKEVKSRRIPIPLRPSVPREFRHLEHFTTSQPGTPISPSNTASSLRVAHRRPDGSWAFTEALYDRERDPMPDSPLQFSPTAFPTSPTSESSGTAFSYDDASSSKTGPPPYVNPMPPPPLPYEGEKLRGRPPRR